MDNKITDKFTTHLKNALKKARELSASMGTTFINPEHITYGLIMQKGSIAAEILTKSGLTPERIRTIVLKNNKGVLDDSLTAKPAATGSFSVHTKKTIEKAALIAHHNNHKYIGTEHLLMSLTQINTPAMLELWEQNKVNLNSIEEQLETVMRSTSRFPDLTQIFEQAKEAEQEEKTKDESKTPALDFFSTDLTDPKQQKSIDPVIGRTDEINRLIHILSRRTKNNPVLIGEPGVGKTAIVEGLAKKILQGDVPDMLLNKKILRLDLSLVVAGTIYRGEFEGRFKQIIDEIKRDPNIIVFIDELHTIIGTGSAAGSMDAANILKPALAKGELRTIGATTLDEYRKHIESDPALERRFQPIIIEEASAEETMEVLRGIKENYERYHLVHISDDAIRAAVEMSARYIQDKFLPDKAIDLIDEAASKIKISQKRDGLLKEIHQTEKEINRVREEKNTLVNKENFERALQYKAQENKLLERLAILRQKQSQSNLQFVGKITRTDIAEVISRMTKIPLQELVVEEKERLLNLEEELSQSIIGQDEAIKAIANAIRRSRVGLADPNRPIASFMFLGPSGVGKTETAKVLARTVFEDEHALIRIDMSEFAEGFNMSKLLGAPAGYVGYKEGNKLTEPVRRKPYSVVLFDEIEKAHPEVFNVLLQIMEDGHLTDATGRQVNFKNTIVIMTSNIGLQNLTKGAEIGFAADSPADKAEAEKQYQHIKERVLQDLEKTFRPELLNRIDSTIVYRPLTKKTIEKIVSLHIAALQEKLRAQQLTVNVTKRAIKFIAEKSFQPNQGARAVRRHIQEHIENVIAEKLLSGTLHAGERVKVTVTNGALTVG
ncbi:MAG: ATP-dependent Clp protease ATP-binding subunit [Candidatus Kerfeldbacteria bacterium]|nr:ATP-dependent Clp protease ATP-binding subunit [Candidatus Kerfeldbacteria bacterium]